MDEKIWFYARNNEQNGPVDIAEIDMLVAAKVIGPDTLVWRDGMAGWQPAASALPASSIPNDWPDTPPPMPQQQPAAAAAPAAPGPQAQPHDDGAEATQHPTQFMDCVKYCFNHYAKFSGRARRAQFWYFVLFNFIANLALGIVDSMLFGVDSNVSLFSSLYSLAVFVPSIAVGARRLHDIGRSGWWQLIGLVPIVGWIILIVWMASRGEDRANQYGPA